MQDELYGSVENAIYQTVNGYVDPATRRRGAVALAPQVGMLPATLSNKANPLQDHQLTLRESIPVQLVANDFQILHAYAQTLHHVAYQLPARRTPVTWSFLTSTPPCMPTSAAWRRPCAIRCATAASPLRKSRPSVRRSMTPPVPVSACSSA
ncbi:MAG: hypothetical protein BGP10_12255 [Rhodanobacter sp. 68-29]|nr:phage regulatory CII family protein [Rhodanobacter sp.]ODV27960.1 MAG: hypothetical protein ABT19_00175 [Rhodanobacter sp. SCN 68-63]OJY60664.1 MAG: hypothetical protein BGP10_12255 [Rhodanobacter sp. 68-29]